MPENKNPENKPEKSTLDKIVMGAIIGTAIGSAIGMTMAPKKGKETRKIVKGEAKEVLDLTKETAMGLFSLAKKLIFGGKGKLHENLKQIPDESQEESDIEIISPTEKDKK